MSTVNGPVSSTDKAIARWNGTAGDTIQDSTVIVDDSGNVTATSFIGPLTGNADTATAAANVDYYAGITGTVRISPHGVNLTAGPDNFGGKTPVDGSLLQFRFSGATGSGAMTAIYAPTLAGLPLYKGDNATPLDDGDIIAEGEYLLIYKTTYFTLVNPSGLGAITSTPGIVVNAATGGAKGAGTINAVGLFVNGASTSGTNTGDQTDATLTFTDITTNNVSSTKHGFAPKSPADATKFLNGDTTPAYAQVKDSDLSTSDITTNNVSTTKHGFAPKAPNDATQYLDGTGAYSVPAGTVGVTYNAIAGCLPSSIAGTKTTATMTVSAGQAADSTNAVYINSAGYSWAVSNGNAINGYQGGTTLPNSSTIHMFLCTGASGTGTFASTSLTPTLPTGYAVSYRRIFSFNTKSTGAPIPYTAIEAEGGSLVCYLTTQLLDISTTTQGTTQTLYTLTVPTGIKVNPIMRFAGESSGSAKAVIVTSGDETDVLPTAVAGTVAPLWDLAGITVDLSDQLYLTTNTSGQIGARGSAAGCVFYAVTRGFKDFRRG